MGLMVSAVEAADHVDVAGFRRPDAEDRARRAFCVRQVGAHFLVNAIVAALVEKIEVFLSEPGNVVADSGGCGRTKVLAHRIDTACRPSPPLNRTHHPTPAGAPEIAPPLSAGASSR